MSTLSQELGYLARRELAVMLDYESPQGKDWRGLADRMNFTYDIILRLRNKPSPTLTLLEEWEKARGKQATLATLITLLESLGCQEAVDTIKRGSRIDRPAQRVNTDAELTVSQSQIHHHPLTPCNSIDPSKISPEEIERIHAVPHQAGVDPQQLVKTLEGITLNGCSGSDEASAQVSQEDVEEKKEFVRQQRFDVFLSYAEEDQEFAEEVRDRLMKDAKVKVFIPVEGLMPGKVFHEEIADMIKKGCRKTIVILSPDYVQSPWCKYEANLAFIKSPDTSAHVLIPIMYRECEVPAFLAPVSYLNYPRYKAKCEDCEKYVWGPLYKSVTFNPRTRQRKS